MGVKMCDKLRSVRRLTFDMRGAWRPKAGKRPLDGRVRSLCWRAKTAPFVTVLFGMNDVELAPSVAQDHLLRDDLARHYVVFDRFAQLV